MQEFSKIQFVTRFGQSSMAGEDMALVIAIFGPTCSEKSNIARELSRRTGWRVRHLGEAAKTRALVRGAHDVDVVPDEELRLVDTQALQFAYQTPIPIIMESGFADCVLAKRDHVFFVRLTATDEVRQQRFERRQEEAGGITRTRQLGQGVAQRDAQDAALRTRLYGECGVEPHLELDTTQASVTECARVILEKCVPELTTAV